MVDTPGLGSGALQRESSSLSIRTKTLLDMRLNYLGGLPVSWTRPTPKHVFKLLTQL